MPNPNFENVDVPRTAFRFEVMLNLDDAPDTITNPLCNAAFAECDGLEMSLEPKSFVQGGDNQRRVHLPGPVSYGQLTLRRGMTGNMHLWQWFEYAALPGHRPTAQGKVILLQSDGSAGVTFYLQDCLPTRMRGPSLNAQQGEVAIEELQLAYARLSLQPISEQRGNIGVGLSGGMSVSGGPDLSASASFNVRAGLKFG